ncbi:MAG: FG-GAP repeat protein [Planctomycetes bacterium]|nr:FG-GAP repeat protein [Planctomycetota bacterium]
MRCLSILVACLLCGSVAEAQYLFRTRSSTFSTRYGQIITQIGDVDLDTVPDVAITIGTGAVDIFSTRTARRLRRQQGTGGWAVAPAGDLDGDGRADIVTGDAGASFNGPSSGTVYVISALTGAVLRQFNGDSSFDNMGYAASGGFDVDGDGVPDVVGGAYADNGNGFASGCVRVWSGATSVELYTLFGDSAGDWFGRKLLMVPDVDGDGLADLIVSAPKDDNAGADSGMVRMFSGATGAILWGFDGWAPGDQLGQSFAWIGDVDADGFGDVAVGAPLSDLGGPDFGACVVLSGGSGSVLQTRTGAASGDNFGVSVAGGRDIDGDGALDLAVGANLNDDAGANAGCAYLYGGVFGGLIQTLRGFAAGDQMGFTVAMLEDSNQDLLADFSVCAGFADYGANDSGAVYDLALRCPNASTYCTAKVNSLGCAPVLGTDGSPSLSSNGGFRILGKGFLNNQPGFLLYGVSGPAAIPFQGGLLCVGPPVNLGPNLLSSGSPPPMQDCSGSYSFDFNAYAFSGAGAVQIHYPGTAVWAQWWSRDTGFPAPNDSSLSNAARFVMCL